MSIVNLLTVLATTGWWGLAACIAVGATVAHFIIDTTNKENRHG